MADSFEPIVVDDRRLLFEFPQCSDQADLEIHHTEDLVVLFKYPDTGPEATFSIKFNRTFAYRYVTQSLCNEFHVNQSIDQLVELTESQWGEEILAQASNRAAFRHFLFFAEDHGALEVLAVDYETGGRPALPPEHQPDETDE